MIFYEQKEVKFFHLPRKRNEDKRSRPAGYITEVVKRKSHGVSIFTSYFCVYLRQAYAKRRRQTHPICLSWSYISDLYFLVVLDWRGTLYCEHQNNERKY